ncbi:MAG: nitroreductase family protein [Brevinematales bacterium]|nr:nitroreductase family protein [Brevinematales bacterium]
MFQELLEKRRSYRALGPIEISEEQIRILAKAASLMPSCFNNQPWRFIFVRSHEVLQDLQKTYSQGNEWAYRASLVIAVVTHPEDDCRLQGKEYALFDTGMAVAAMLLMGTEMGFVLHPIAGFDTRAAQKVLGIPEERILVTLIVVGQKNDDSFSELRPHQQEAERHRPERKPFSEFVFIERWGNPLEASTENRESSRH